MKIRNLKLASGKAVASAWPPDWGGSYGRGDSFPTGEEGVLVSVERSDDHLFLTIKHGGREQSGTLRWTAPPSLEDVESVLLANRGKPIKAISDLDVPEK